MDKITKDEITRALKKYEKKQVLVDKPDYVPRDDLNDPLAKSHKNLIDEFTSKDIEKIESLNPDVTASSEFKQFEIENKPVIHSWYEKWCRFSGNIIKISPGKNQKPKYEGALSTANMNIQPEDAFSFAILGPLIYMLLGLACAYLFLKSSMFFISFFLLSGIGIMIPATKLPFIFADTERLKQSKEIVLSIFYMVTYMRQNSNLEKAIEFAADHLNGPLAKDLKKVLWDIESEKYESIIISLEHYLEKWRKTNSEFLEAMNLIESSLSEAKEENRIALLDKALDVILSETYEKMLHYTHDIQSPINTLHMLGVILPILGLVILPLIVVFMGGIRWYHISILYNVVIPVSVFFIGKNILSTRPGGTGGTEIAEDNPAAMELKEKAKKGFCSGFSPLFIGLFIGISLLVLGLSPLILHELIGEGNDLRLFADEWNPETTGIKVLDYRESTTLVDESGNPVLRGPYGLISSLFGILIVMGLGFGIGFYYKYKTKDLIKIRNATKKLENEFGSAIFQLGNRLGDGIPLEMSFSRVSKIMGDSEPGKFFNMIDQSIRRRGMSVEMAIFDPKMGAIAYFPSNLIKSTMKVLIESIKKGPLIAARAMMNVSRYVKEMHSVEERLKDLLAEVISSMNSLIKFLAPVISGIVVGITSMITTIIGTLSIAMNSLGSGTDGSGAMGNLVSMFSEGIPSYYFQIVVGIYIVQIVFIVSKTISGIGSGDDKLGEENLSGNYLIKSVIIYALTTAIVMIIFNTIAISVLGNMVNADVV